MKGFFITFNQNLTEMKNLYFLLFCMIPVSFFSQHNEEAEMKSLIESEAGRYSKISGYNVNPNTLNYDLRYQRLELNVNPDQVFISGKVTSHFIPNENISAIYFDFTNGLTVSEVKYHNTNLTFSQLSSKEIKINFSSALPANVLDSLSISYSGVPDPSQDGLYFMNTSDGKVAFSLTEPYGAREWFPTKQSMNDKIEKLDLKITTPSQYSTAGNGLLISETELPDNKKLAFWQTNYPIPAYLVAIGVSNYVKMNDTMGNPPFAFVNYIFPSSAANSSITNNIEWTKTVMNLYEEYYGPYPYRNEKYGHMEMTFGGGMEHATMTTLSGFSRNLIAHELTHQWFGDKITCGKWNDIWLNEGFATFGDHLAREKLLSSYTSFMNFLANEKEYITSLPGGSVYVPDGSEGDKNRVFNGRLSYSKGAYVLRMLKWILGDDAFYQAIREYVNRPDLAYNYAVTSDFNASLLQSTGKDFTEFFNDWVYGQGYPEYTIKWKQSGNHIAFKVDQAQSHSSVSFFEMPLPIKLNGTNGETEYLKLENTYNGQYFVNPVNFTVSSVEFNYEYQMLERNSTVALDPALSVENIEKNSVKIYPNPVKDMLHISGNPAEKDFEIINSEGRSLMKGNMRTEINVAKLPKGIYLLKTENSVFKFIKE